MPPEKGTKNFLESFADFMSDPEYLSTEEMRNELTENGIDVDLLERRVSQIVHNRKAETLLSRRTKLEEKRAIFEKILNARDISRSFTEFQEIAKKIVITNFGQAAGSLIEAHLRSKDTFSDSDFENLMEDIDLFEELATPKEED